MCDTRRAWLALWVLCLLSVVAPAGAGYLEFFGEDLADGVNPAIPHPAADAAQAQFLANLVGVGVEDFESFVPGQTAPLAVSFGAGETATLTGTGRIGDGLYAGRFPISGTQYWVSTEAFAIDFSSPQAAFGFYGTDIGDFGGQITLTLTTGSTETLTVPNTVGAPNGSALYHGFLTTDPGEQFVRIAFGNTAANVDYFGFDDMTVGSLENVALIPEPASVVLLGLGAAGLLLRRRRRSR